VDLLEALEAWSADQVQPAMTGAVC